jgi:hypothetical protein
MPGYNEGEGPKLDCPLNPLNLEEVSASEALFLVMSVLLLWTELDEEQPDGKTSEIDVQPKFFMPRLCTPGPAPFDDFTPMAELRGPLGW